MTSLVRAFYLRSSTIFAPPLDRARKGRHVDRKFWLTQNSAEAEFFVPCSESNSLFSTIERAR